MNKIGKRIKKIDSEAIVLGKPLYTADLAVKGALCIKILRSPYAHAYIQSIDTTRAKMVVGIEDIYTYEDVPKNKFCLAGQSYPEPSAYDRLILDRTLRYVGDAVALVVGKDEKACNEAIKHIKVVYEERKALLDFETSVDNEIIVHNEDDIYFKASQGLVQYDVKRNICGERTHSFGEDPEETFINSPIQIDEYYETQAQQHCMMETFRSYAYMDQWMRLNVISSTQVPFHIKRQLAVALGISSSKIRIIKPRVGGGFGAKQTSVTEIYAGFVTMKTGKPSMIVFSREEAMEAGNTRHKTKIRVKIGAEKDGTINVIDVDALSDQGAYGEHAWTTLGLIGEKSLPLYRLKSARFHGRTVYTNKVPGGAFRGYGATQGLFAVESAVNELAKKLEMNPVDIRLKNIVEEGETTLAYGKTINSSKLKECIIRGRKLMDWDNKYPSRTLTNGKIRSVGMAVAMQGSGIANIDVATAQIKLNEEGDYSLLMSPTDTGTGTDTALTQMAAEVLNCDIDEIITIVADTDITPYDPGSYASSGIYTTGGAVINAAKDLREKILEEAAKRLEVDMNNLDLIQWGVINTNGDERISLRNLAEALSVGPKGKTIIGTGSFGSEISPPPFMAGFVETEIDPLTGKVDVVDYKAVVDCGTVINANLAKVQTEGGIVQGIGLALYENIIYSKKGKLITNNLMQYKIPTRKEVSNIDVEFIESYEPTGPFGAKSIGELVINTPSPAIAAAIANGTGKNFRKLPITPENILLGKQ